MAQSKLPCDSHAGEDHAQAAGQERRGAEPPPVASPRSILVVDDQPAVGVSVAYYLEMCGYRTHRAESGDAAINFLGTQPVDGVLLDVQMPRMNGFETCVRLHETARAANRTLKIWFMTGIHYRELGDECAKAGGLGVFHKPFDWPQLLAVLDRGLGAQTDSGPAAPVAG
jgi:CheY-like chemotaxis protein